MSITSLWILFLQVQVNHVVIVMKSFLRLFALYNVPLILACAAVVNSLRKWRHLILLNCWIVCIGTVCGGSTVILCYIKKQFSNKKNSSRAMSYNSFLDCYKTSLEFIYKLDNDAYPMPSCTLSLYSFFKEKFPSYLRTGSLHVIKTLYECIY